MADQRAAANRERTVGRIVNADAFKPLVLVVASDGARALAAANGGLGVEDLLQPFGTIRGSVPIRNKDRQYNLQQFGVRFVDVDHLMPATQSNIHSIDQTLSSIVKRTTPGKKDETPAEAARERLDRQQIRSERDVNRFFERTAATNARSPQDPPDMTPWWTQVIDELSDEVLRGQQWDMFCHPIVLLYVVSSTSEPNQADPVALASKMLDPRSLPGVMTSGQYNRNVPSMILVLHDNQKESVKKPESMAKKISSSTGMPKELVKVLRLNSFSTSSSESADQSDLWTPCMTHSASQRANVRRKALQGAENTNTVRRGGCLSSEDMVSIQNFMAELVQNVVVRQIESRIFSLTASVAKSKGGMRNAIKSWWRKPKSDTSSNTSSRMVDGEILLYESSSIESQVRLLADLLFMVHDYENASHYYSMVRSDYKSDKAWLHHASCSTMLALCGFCASSGNYHAGSGEGGSGRDSSSVQASIEEGLQPLLSTEATHSGRSGTSGRQPQHHQWLVVRMTLWSVAIAADMYRSVPFGGPVSLLKSAKYLLACAWYENARGSSLIAGMMQEQASLCTLSVPRHSNSIQESGLNVRQAGHQMVQAGHKYLEHGLIQHALHCYGCVEPLYEEGWSRVDTHVLHSVSTQLSAMGANKEAGERLLRLTSSIHPNDSSRVLMSELDERLQRIVMFDLFRIVGTNSHSNSTNDEQSPSELNSASSTATPPRKQITTMCIPTVMDATLRTMVNENPSETSTLGTGWSCVPSPASTMVGLAAKRARSWEKLSASAAWCRRGWDIMREPRQHRDNLEYVSTKQQAKDVTLPPQWCSINEPVEIDFVLKNPLSVKLCLRDITLVASVLNEEGGESEEGEKRSSSNTDLQCDTLESLELGPNCDTVLRMRLVPLRVGILRVEGIQWCLGPTSEDREGYSVPVGDIPCLHMFELLGPRVHDTRDQRAMGARRRDTRLDVQVVGPRPWIGLHMTDDTHNGSGEGENNNNRGRSNSGSYSGPPPPPRPRVVSSGSLLPLTLTLMNYGDASAKYVTLSSNCVVVPEGCTIASADGNASLFRLPITPLGPEETRVVRLTLRVPATTGIQDIYVMIEYSEEEDIPKDIGALFIVVVAVVVVVVHYCFMLSLYADALVTSYTRTSHISWNRYIFLFLLNPFSPYPPPFIFPTPLHALPFQSHVHFVSDVYFEGHVPFCHSMLYHR